MKSQKGKGSKTYICALLLSLAGGYLDAYTYTTRGGVFANAQTGNVIKLALSISNHSTDMTERYIGSIIAFCIGILLSKHIEYTFQKQKKHIIRRTILSIEIILLFITGFIPETASGNLMTCIIISFVCALQMETFKSFDEGTFATTVSTGNLRKAMESLYNSIQNHNKQETITALKYLFIVILFSIGVVAGSLITKQTGIQSVWMACLILTITWIHIHKRYQKIK